MYRLYLSYLGGKTLSTGNWVCLFYKVWSSPTLQEVRSTRGSNAVSNCWEKLVCLQENQTFLQQTVKRKKKPYILNYSKEYIFQIKENLAKERKKYQNSRARYFHWLEYYVWFRWDDYYKQDMTTLINVTSESKIKILQRKLTHVEYRWVKLQAASL